MWEKTVMSDDEMWEHQTFGLRSGAIPQLQVEEIAKHQAELTGDIAFKAGIQEVISYAQTTRDLGNGTVYVVLSAPKDKLKDWGIEA